jgi:diguanylate cyclase (GGDEF)-like protein/PAS domain S-box-containing protein
MRKLRNFIAGSRGGVITDCLFALAIAAPVFLIDAVFDQDMYVPSLAMEPPAPNIGKYVLFLVIFVVNLIGLHVIRLALSGAAAGREAAERRASAADDQRDASFRLLFEGSPLPMWVYDQTSMLIVAVNRAAVEAYGYSREHFVGMPVSRLLPQVDRPAARPDEGGDPSRAKRHVRADGTAIDVETYVSALTYSGRAARLLAAIDVTERKRAEDEARRAQGFLDTVLENVPAPILVKDASDLRYAFVNRAAEQFLGLSRDRILGVKADSFLCAPEAERIEVRDKEALGAQRTVYTDIHPMETPANGVRLVATTRVPIRAGHAVRHLMVFINDMTDKWRAEAELHSTREFLDLVVENVPATILVKDPRESRYVHINRAAEEFFGLPRERIIGQTAHEIFPAAVADAIAARDSELLESGFQVFAEEQSLHTPRSGTRFVTSKRLIIRDEKGEPLYLLSVIDDVTAQRQAQARIAHLAHHDPLTDLPNRTAFTERLAAMLDQVAATQETFAVLSVDLDWFKDVNDVFGHAAGDAVLCEVAQRLRVAAGDAFVSRLGGDEFMLISTGPQPAGAAALAERLSTLGAEEFEVHGQRLRIGFSIGVAICPGDGTDAATLLGNADAALYRAKAEGRGAFRFFESDMDKQLRDGRALQLELRSAIANGELTVYYQPQAEVDGTITGFEALIRWRHPARGFISPGAFIPVAERSGAIIPIGEWILSEVCREAASWPKPLRVSVNVSTVQFRHGDLVALVHSALLKSGLAPGRLELEITESALIGDLARAVAILRQLKALGVRIVMDDFGTGYSSLSYLQSFPFDKIKIDRAFITNLDRTPQAAAIIRAIIGLARGLSLPITAEGVETEAQLAFLAREGCNEVQGYLIGRPYPIEDYADVVGIEPARLTDRALAG